jgi:3-oxoacyl-(acyl-carrier-protein) synthase|tara:strand:- start:8436 stop:8624 length:189 start_codon:yes stop_codon:yes gene_type:complete
MNEDDYKNLISTYQRKSMDLFTQLVVAETKVEMLDAQLREAKLYIQKLENGVEDPQEEGNYE